MNPQPATRAVVSLISDSLAAVMWPGTDATQCRERIHGLFRAIVASPLTRCIHAVPGFESLSIHFDPLWMSLDDVRHRVMLLDAAAGGTPLQRRVVRVPMCHDAALAMDLADVAEHCGLTPNDVVERFCSVEFIVQMIGFSPGFPYLAGLPEELHVPRRATPRTSVPRGSIAIGGSQAGIYPNESPGGWNIIGRTPLTLFDATQADPCLFDPGDRVVFDPISLAEFRTRAQST